MCIPGAGENCFLLYCRVRDGLRKTVRKAVDVLVKSFGKERKERKARRTELEVAIRDTKARVVNDVLESYIQTQDITFHVFCKPVRPLERFSRYHGHEENEDARAFEFAECLHDLESLETEGVGVWSLVDYWSVEYRKEAEMRVRDALSQSVQESKTPTLHPFDLGVSDRYLPIPRTVPSPFQCHDDNDDYNLLRSAPCFVDLEDLEREWGVQTGRMVDLWLWRTESEISKRVVDALEATIEETKNAKVEPWQLGVSDAFFLHDGHIESIVQGPDHHTSITETDMVSDLVDEITGSVTIEEAREQIATVQNFASDILVQTAATEMASVEEITASVSVEEASEQIVTVENFAGEILVQPAAKEIPSVSSSVRAAAFDGGLLEIVRAHLRKSATFATTEDTNARQTSSSDQTATATSEPAPAQEIAAALTEVKDVEPVAAVTSVDVPPATKTDQSPPVPENFVAPAAPKPPKAVKKTKKFGSPTLSTDSPTTTSESSAEASPKPTPPASPKSLTKKMANNKKEDGPPASPVSASSSLQKAAAPAEPEADKQQKEGQPKPAQQQQRQKNKPSVKTQNASSSAPAELSTPTKSSTPSLKPSTPPAAVMKAGASYADAARTSVQSDPVASPCSALAVAVTQAFDAHQRASVEARHPRGNAKMASNEQQQQQKQKVPVPSSAQAVIEAKVDKTTPVVPPGRAVTPLSVVEKKSVSVTESLERFEIQLEGTALADLELEGDNPLQRRSNGLALPITDPRLKILHQQAPTETPTEFRGKRIKAWKDLALEKELAKAMVSEQQKGKITAFLDKMVARQVGRMDEIILSRKSVQVEDEIRTDTVRLFLDYETLEWRREEKEDRVPALTTSKPAAASASTLSSGRVAQAVRSSTQEAKSASPARRSAAYTRGQPEAPRQSPRPGKPTPAPAPAPTPAQPAAAMPRVAMLAENNPTEGAASGPTAQPQPRLKAAEHIGPRARYVPPHRRDTSPAAQPQKVPSTSGSDAGLHERALKGRGG
ncbi:hypothetical protein HK097_010853, partial [Rhizophlyctis rosea]